MQQLKICAFLLILAVGDVKSYSVLQINDQNSRLSFGDSQVIMNSTTWLCDRILCPRDTTDRCVITKKNLDDNQAVVRRENYCLSADNRNLNNFSQDENVGPNVHISENTVVSHNGMISSSMSDSNFHFSNMDPETEKKFQQNMQEMRNELNQSMQKMRENLDQSMKDLQKNLQSVFGRGPF